MIMELQETTTTEEIAQAGKKKRGAIVLSVLMALAVLLCIFVIGQVLGKGYVSVGKYSLFRVVTGSMEPTMPVGTVLITKDTPVDQIRVGDIVTFRSQKNGMFNVVVTHRVISVQEGRNGKLYLETKGDANPSADGSYVEEAYLIGKVVFFTGKDNILTKILSFITGRIGFLSCIVLPCVIIGTLIMRDCITGMRKELDDLNEQIDTIDQESKQISAQQMDEEEYRELCQRLRDELMKELKHGAEQETTEQKPGAGQK